jgi:hypothetical protein
MESSACTDAIVLRVMDKLNSFEETVNQKLALLEAQLQELTHSTPASTSGVHERFRVSAYHPRSCISAAHSYSVLSKDSRG